MERYVKEYDKDYMKMAMLKQEETFRHQVHELHRVYRVQKLMMNDMKAELKRQRKSTNSRNKLDKWNTDNEMASHRPRYSFQDQRRPKQALDLELPAEEYIGKDDRGVILDVEEDSDLELTLATGSKNRRKKENSSTSDSGGSLSSSTESDAMVKLNRNQWGVFQVPGIQLGNCQRERKNVFNVEEQMREERVKQPPWLFHCLSLNMTR